MSMRVNDGVTHPGMGGNPELDHWVQKMMDELKKDQLSELRKDFHTRLRLTLTHPQQTELVEDLWDFFYDWCLFEQKLPDKITMNEESEKNLWENLKESAQRGLYSVTKVDDRSLKLKELFQDQVFVIHKQAQADLIGISKGDIVEARLMKSSDEEGQYSFVRKPSFHSLEVHPYIKLKVKQFRKDKDFNSYQNWLWLLVGMYVKHRLYEHMPIEKIYNDNSRI